MTGTQPLDPEAESIQRTGDEVLHQHIGTGDERFERGMALGGLHVQLDALLATVQPQEPTRQTRSHRVVIVTREVPVADTLDFNHPRTGIGEMTRRQRSCNSLFERHHHQAIQWCTHGAALLVRCVLNPTLAKGSWITTHCSYGDRPPSVRLCRHVISPPHGAPIG